MIFLTGDTHGQPLSRLSAENFPEGKKLTKSDYVIILGDFGFVWGIMETKEEAYWLNWLNNKPWTTLFVDGNHENHTALGFLDTKEMFGADVGVVRKSVLHMRRGRCYTIDGQRFLALGGADSIDKGLRTVYKSWWPEEALSYDDMVRIEKTCDEHNWEFDYVLAHDCPIHAVPPSYHKHLFESKTQNYLTSLSENLIFKKWFYGHWHVNHKSDCGKFECIYEQVKRLEVKGGQ
jgi:hypothetical protein